MLLICERAVVVAVITTVCVVVFLTMLTLPFGLDDLNFIQTYNADEFRQISALLTNIKERSLDPHGLFIYGYLYYSIAYFILEALHWFQWNIDIMLIGLTCRLLSVSFGLLAFIALYRFGMIGELPRELAAAAALLFFTIPEF